MVVGQEHLTEKLIGQQSELDMKMNMDKVMMHVAILKPKLVYIAQIFV